MIRASGIFSPKQYLVKLGITDPCEAINALCCRMEEVRKCCPHKITSTGAAQLKAHLQFRMDELRSEIRTQEDKAMWGSDRIEWVLPIPDLDFRAAGLPDMTRPWKGQYMCKGNYLKPRKAEVRR